MTEEYYIGQIFEGMYPKEASDWCNERHDAYIDEIERIEDVRRFEIKAIPQPTPVDYEKWFTSDFFEVPNFGWYRKRPKGYSSAVESLNTAFNIVAVIGSLPADTLIFYQEPDFTDPSTCTEEWLVEHQTKNPAMSAQEFGAFYASFITAWNTQEHN